MVKYYFLTRWVIGSLLVLVAGCSNTIIDQEPDMYTSSGSIAPYLQPSFDQYVDETRQWLDDTRVFHGAGYRVEMDVVSPYRLRPQNPNGQGILLVHGLGDSPYSFVDIAPYLARHGYLVQVMLLPGHGSRPADLMNPTNEDWRQAVEHQIYLLQKEVDTVWLGGFSTGTNLVTSYVVQSTEKVKGLILFSPAFVPKDPFASMAGFASHFVDWASLEKEQNYTRYDSLAMRGAALYYQSSIDVREAITKSNIDVPTILMVTETDELINAKAVYDLFTDHFRHPSSSLIWFGEQEYSDPRFVLFPMNIPDSNIQSGSHISVLYQDTNPLYGRRGLMRQCGGQQAGEVYRVDCAKMPTLSYSAWGLFDEDTISARLSWNPYFEPMMVRVLEFMSSDL
ncbi:Esterase/lipase [Vibrio hangzhouensis]|uniref:Esterase/lipase n=2 Tax=Vibrio hangzhouensis TaxID=462991 RepID=A0A1H5YKS4_9VIBR|nr:Esterase/lipase [Vibrio hangzhouensis]